MRTLWAASLRHLLGHPAQLVLALAGLALGVATIVAVDIATASAYRAFELSIDAVSGSATHEIVGGPAGIDEALYVRLASAGMHLSLAPLVDGYVEVGDRTLQLVGFDPFASPDFRRLEEFGHENIVALPGGNLAQWLTLPGTVLMAPPTARELGLTAGGTFPLIVSGRTVPARLLAPLRVRRPGDESLILTDIAQAQEWLGLPGKLSRIEVKASADAVGEAALYQLRARLPAGLALLGAEARSRDNAQMAGSFTTNLQAMSLLALLVGLLLIYSAVSFAVVQRRRIIGVLRALGATRASVLAIVLGEAAAIGIVGTALGLLAGIAIGRELIELVSRTINDLYFVVAVNHAALPASSIVKAAVAGIGVALLAAAVPAAEAAYAAPQLALRRSALEMRALTVSRGLLVTSALCAAAAGAIVIVSGRSVFAGFVALFLLLLSVAALAPAGLRAGARAGARALGSVSPILRLACGDIAASLSRTGVAVAALSLAVCAMIGVSIMVDSFRESLREWLMRTLRADVYVSAPGPGFGRPERRIEPAVLSALLSTPGIADHSESRRISVGSNRGLLALDALSPARASYSNLVLTAGDRQQAWAQYAHGALLVSEPLAWRLRLGLHDRLTLTTAAGPRTFEIAAIYREYGNDRGTVLMSRAIYREWWHDDAITGVALYLTPGLEAATVIERLRSIATQRLLIRSNAQVRDLSLGIFERTFVITRVLYWLTAGVAALSLVSALLAWELERTRELALLRALGVTPRGLAALIEAQSAFMGVAAWLAAAPAGVLVGLTLIDVVNRRAFGWQIDLHLNAAQFGTAALVSGLAALVAGIYPAVRSARMVLLASIREE